MLVTDIAWLAGIIEGEGSLFYNKFSIGIVLRMTDRDVVERAARIFGGPSICTLEPRGRGTKQVHGFSVYGSRAAGWMMTLYPHLGQRRRAKVRELLATWKTQRNNTSHKLKGAHSPSSEAHENQAA